MTAPINIMINGQKISTQSGITILQAARQAGIDIPTLCDHPALSSAGACRICVVEVKGQRNLQTACTFPVTEGMEIQTDSPQTIKARKLVLDMLFSERNHFCPYCEASGSCELQSLGYRYGIDHWVFPTYTKRFPLDASHKYYLMEHNRCILCSRCVRACEEIVANHTLGLRQRGNESMINADTNIPLGASSCVSCGTCVEVCPTGALSDKRSAFTGRNNQTEKIKTTCNKCSVGCGMEIIVRDGNVLRIGSDWDAPVNKGLLCVYGRYEPLQDERRRVTEPLLRKKGNPTPINWTQAMQTLARKIKSTPSKDIGFMASSDATNEAFYLIDKIFRSELKIDNIGLMDKSTPVISQKPLGSVSAVVSGDVILLIGADPAKDQPVASFMIKRAVDHGSRLIIVDDEENGLSPFAYMNLSSHEVDTAVDMLKRAQHPFIVYGVGIAPRAIEILKNIGDKADFLTIEPGVNTKAAAAIKLNNDCNPSSAKLLYILAGEQNDSGVDLIKDIPRKSFVVVQTSYLSPLTERADLVLPAAIWSERSGSLTNTTGLVQMAHKAIEPPGAAKVDWEILSLLAEKLDKKIDVSIEETAAYFSRLFK